MRISVEKVPSALLQAQTGSKLAQPGKPNLCNFISCLYGVTSGELVSWVVSNGFQLVHRGSDHFTKQT